LAFRRAALGVVTFCGQSGARLSIPGGGPLQESPLLTGRHPLPDRARAESSVWGALPIDRAPRATDVVPDGVAEFSAT
jgi:hypothetical protein